MAVRDKSNRWTDEAVEFNKEVENALLPILHSWSDTLTLEDMHYIVSRIIHKFILDVVLEW